MPRLTIEWDVGASDIAMKIKQAALTIILQSITRKVTIRYDAPNSDFKWEETILVDSKYGSEVK